jgi:hypothetical protein
MKTAWWGGCQQFKQLAETPISEETRGIVRLRCKMWNCAYCARLNAEQWRDHISKAIARFDQNPDNGLWLFVTITAHRRAHAAHRTIQNILTGWPRLRKRLAREFGGFSFVRVLERHKSGAYHMHLLMRVKGLYVTRDDFRSQRDGKVRYRGRHYRTIKQHAVECGMGYMVDVSPLVNEHLAPAPALVVARYITKYMTKHAARDFPPKVRRIVTSRDIGAPKAGTGSRDWNVRSGIFAAELEKWDFWWLGRSPRVLTLEDFECSLYFPPDF